MLDSDTITSMISIYPDMTEVVAKTAERYRKEFVSHYPALKSIMGWVVDGDNIILSGMDVWGYDSYIEFPVAMLYDYDTAATALHEQLRLEALAEEERKAAEKIEYETQAVVAEKAMLWDLLNKYGAVPVLQTLIADSDRLSALEACGVDNWEGYWDAFSDENDTPIDAQDVTGEMIKTVLRIM